MRISDWSSDVCSSDLPKQATSEGIQDRITGLNKAIKNLRETDAPTLGDLMSFARAAPSVQALADRHWTADASVTSQRATRDQENGRAACRARECQDG